ncbi:MAG TPA: hypothetical protein VIV11_04745 [Kofleriaceae bacterium]
MSEDLPYEGLLARARTALRGTDLELAERCGRDALMCKPERGDAYNVLALVRLMQHERARAKALLRAGLAVDPSASSLQLNLGRLGRIGAGPLLLGDEVCEASPYRKPQP